MVTIFEEIFISRFRRFEQKRNRLCAKVVSEGISRKSRRTAVKRNAYLFNVSAMAIEVKVYSDGEIAYFGKLCIRQR